MATHDPEFYESPKFSPEPDELRPRQRGCFFYGCIIASILALLMVILVAVGAFFLYRFANQMVALTQQGDTNGPAGFDKMPGGDEAIAAVVTRPTQNDNGPRLPAPSDFACYGSAGTLHHIDGWYAGGNRQTIGLGHLANTEQRRLAIHHICATFPIEADWSNRSGPVISRRSSAPSTRNHQSAQATMRISD